VLSLKFEFEFFNKIEKVGQFFSTSKHKHTAYQMKGNKSKMRI